METMMERRRRE